MSSKKQQMCLFVHVFLFSVSIFVFENAQARNLSLATSLGASNSIARSLYSFGDSFVDPGNNCYLPTEVKCDFRPYGKDYPGGPTGRFSNGLLFPDFLARQLLKENTRDQIPYLKGGINYKEQPAAISFASAGSGYDPDTADKNKVMSMADQVDKFREYQTNLGKEVDKYTADNQINQAVFYINAGLDDFVFNYFGNVNCYPTKKELEDYSTDTLLGTLEDTIKGLSSLGARRFAVTGLPPLGCIPITISKVRQNQRDLQTANTNKGGLRKCLDDVNRNVKEMINPALRDKLGWFENSPETKELGLKMAYIDVYTPLLDAIQNPKRRGFSEVSKGCCGTGFTEIGTTCNEAPVCDDPSKYVFWDAEHPTEKTNRIIYNYNLGAIFKVMGD